MNVIYIILKVSSPTQPWSEAHLKAIWDGYELPLKLALFRVQVHIARVISWMVDRSVAVVLDGEGPVNRQPQASCMVEEALWDFPRGFIQG